jgi:hypothetical protein
MNLGENLEFDGMLNTTRAQQFLNSGVKNRKLNKLFLGDPEGMELRRESFKKELGRLWRNKGTDISD